MGVVYAKLGLGVLSVESPGIPLFVAKYKLACRGLIQAQPV